MSVVEIAIGLSILVFVYAFVVAAKQDIKTGSVPKAKGKQLTIGRLQTMTKAELLEVTEQYHMNVPKSWTKPRIMSAIIKALEL